MLFIIILILSFASAFFMPWWVAAIVAFVAAYYAAKTPAQAFWSGFSAIVLVWLALALLKTIPNNHILASRVAKLFGLPGWGYVLLITCLIGGLVGGLSALSGLLVRRAIKG